MTGRGPSSGGRYARVEIERRFLLERLPDESPATAPPRTIEDRYLRGTRLRLRRQADPGRMPVFKLTQKIPTPAGDGRQGTLTTIYLAPEEHAALASLPGDELRKVRHRLAAPLVVDVFQGALKGLILAEAEFASTADARAFRPPETWRAEVTDDGRFAGGVLVRSARADVVRWVAEYGLDLDG